jgi:UDP-glucuronate 4-epimerase
MDSKKKILVTGSAGFIGFHLAEALLKRGYRVVGVDSFSPYYDVRIKERRNEILSAYPEFKSVRRSITDHEKFQEIVTDEKPDEIIHLAAQAGVRYSLTHPWQYADANFLGTLSVFEAARHAKLPRVIYASSSSVYGLSKKRAFKETDRVDTPISLYAVTKRSNELLAHSYNHLFGIEMIGLRFFTVYGPWGRPDMALFKFARGILSGETIEVYNAGKMKRSFTYIDDVIPALITLIEQPAQHRNEIYNLGGAEAVPLKRFITLIEKAFGKKARKNLAPLQPGDVPATIADCAKAARELGYAPRTSIGEGIAHFAKWFRENEEFLLSLEKPAQ